MNDNGQSGHDQLAGEPDGKGEMLPVAFMNGIEMILAFFQHETIVS